ncbi:MAG TPA: YlxR family protein [Candidatus Dojkabacteria bacterium]|nr:YlxR family protein [Candidatus Dojkabacteria bacterium]
MADSSERKIHTPMRMCAVTREKLPKKELVRLAVMDGKVVIDEKGKVRSRGLNIKPEIEVFDKLVKSGGIKRGLGITLSADGIEILRNEFEKHLSFRSSGKHVVRISSDKLNQLLGSKDGK